MKSKCKRHIPVCQMCDSATAHRPLGLQWVVTLHTSSVRSQKLPSPESAVTPASVGYFCFILTTLRVYTNTIHTVTHTYSYTKRIILLSWDFKDIAVISWAPNLYHIQCLHVFHYSSQQLWEVRLFWSPFIDVETEAKKDEVICPSLVFFFCILNFL